MLHLERVTDVAHPLYACAMRLYQNSFPAYELRKAASQAEILGNLAYHFDLIYDDDVFVGEVLYWEIGEMLYIEHFCILPEMRNRQYGQKVLALLQKQTLLLEIDPPVDEISLRRKGFYERCGLVENAYPHVHPPYHRENAGHPLVVMSSPKLLTRQEYDAFRQYLNDVIMKNVY